MQYDATQRYTMQYNATQRYTILCNTMQDNATQCKTTLYNAMPSLCDAIQCNTMEHNSIQYNATQCYIMQDNAIQCNTLQHNAIQCNTMQYNAIHCIPCHTMQTRVQCKTFQYWSFSLLQSAYTPDKIFADKTDNQNALKNNSHYKSHPLRTHYRSSETHYRSSETSFNRNLIINLSKWKPHLKPIRTTLVFGTFGASSLYTSEDRIPSPP